MTRWLTIAICALLALGVAACGDDNEGGGGSSSGGGDLKGTIAIDGSSTVQPFAQAALELFQEENPDVRITVGGAGTGDGFEKFCRGELEHRGRLAADRGRGEDGLQEDAASAYYAGPGRQRRHRHRLQQVACRSSA